MSAIKVLFLTLGPIADPSSRVRVYQYLDYLSAAGIRADCHPALTDDQFVRLRSSWLRKDKLAIFLLQGKIASARVADLVRASQYDIVYILRNVMPLFMPIFELALSKAGIRTVFDFDDMLLDDADQSPVLGANRSGLRKWLFKNRMSSVLKSVDCVVAGSPYLVERTKRFNRNVFLIPSSVDLRRYTLRSNVRNEECVKIGWRGGASTTLYLEQLRPVFQELWQRYPNRFRVIINGPEDFQPYGPYMQVRPFSLEMEIRDLHEFDIGIMPLHDTVWVRGKCAFKAIEYMGAGIPNVSSPYGAVTSIVKDGVNGFLAETPSEWVEKLSRLIEDTDLRERIGYQGRLTVERGYSIQANAPKLIGVLEQVACKNPK